ncbi:g11605 [Coccomyxa viridis]|uniref:Cell division control protein n=1 Tax=Coccomyxa viridis TaxID=1274662 RepID=A0ABP1GB13_9CHLO
MSPTKTFKRKQQAVSKDAETAASSKRHRGNPAADQKCRDSPKENAAELTLRSDSIQPSQPFKHDVRGPHLVQSPSRPPLLPRTPATADRTGRIPGGLLRQESSLKPCALAPSSQQDWFDPRQPDKVAQVKSVLHTSYLPEEEEPLGRFEQMGILQACISASISSRSGTCVYVSGLPGTGKTLTVHAVARASARQAVDPTAAPVLLSINCMTLQTPSHIFRRILDGLNTPQLACPADAFVCPGSQPGSATEGSQAALESLKKALELPSEAPGARRLSTPSKIRRARGMAVVILDEMDQLLSQDHSVLYDLFRLPQAPNSRLILIGIANSIDLTERALPRLQATGCRPTLVTFPSYSSLQLECLLQQRLQALPGPVFQPQAVRLAAKKMASRSGDMRRLLDACTAAVDLLVQDATEQQSEHAKGDALGQDSGPAVPQPKLVGIAPMFRAISQLQGGSAGASAMVTAVKGLPTQQQLLLCAATSLLGADGPPPGISTPSASFGQRRSSLGFNSPLSVRKQRRLSFGTDVVRTPGKINMSRPSSTSDNSRLSSGSRQRDCQLGQLQTAYFGLCKKVSFKPLAASEVTAACSTLADMGFLDLGHASEERQRRVTLRIAVEDVALGLQDVRLFRDCLPVPE